MTTTFNAEFAYHLNKAGFVSTEETRYYLTGICVEKCLNQPGCYLVATDVHRIGIFYDEHATTDTSGIIVHLSKAALKDLKHGRSDAARLVHVDGARVTIADTHEGPDGALILGTPDATKVRNDMAGSVIDGSFPDWRRVIPPMVDPGKRAEYVYFNPAYLADFNMKPFEGGSGGYVIIEQSGKGSPVFIQHSHFPTFAGVLMPLRGNRETVRPGWLDDTPMAQATAAE